MLIWEIKSWDEVSKEEFYEITQLRIDVFVIEQNCPYQDLDGNDKYSHHVIGRTSSGELVGYSRIVFPGKTYPEVSIGRVVVKENMRGKKIGYELMKVSIEGVVDLYGKVKVHISAQEHLAKYYTNLGFVKTTDMYLEDNIPHIGMDISW